MQLLEWSKLSQKMQQELTSKVKILSPNGDKYVAIIYLWEDKSSKVYVWHKQNIVKK